jgi:hypothetical protein
MVMGWNMYERGMIDLNHPSPPQIHPLIDLRTVRALAASAVAPAPFKTDKSNAVFEEAKVHYNIRARIARIPSHQTQLHSPSITNQNRA